MGILIQNIINSVIQIVLFSAIPFIWWLITARNKCNFFEWIGIKKINNKENKIFFWTLAVTLAFLILSVFILSALKDVEMAASEYSNLGFKAIPAILVYAILNTSLPEEILFRGFILKRIADKFGFNVGNIVQAVLFGLLHGIMFFSAVGLIKAIIIAVFTGAVGWFMGYINEKKADGSILPGWCIHAIANIFSGLYSAFPLI